MGLIEGDEPASDNDWESVTRGGDAAIQRWIDNQMVGTSCLIVLIGAETAGRKWIDYEIRKAWNDGKGVLGIHVHNLKNRHSQQSWKGNNPFSLIGMQNGGVLSSYVTVYDPPYSESTQVYGYISQNLAAWVEAAIRARTA